MSKRQLNLFDLSMIVVSLVIGMGIFRTPVVAAARAGTPAIFFLAWALAWQDKSRPEEVERRLAIDPHSPNEFRCNQIVRNINEFYEAFSVVDGDDLWLDPSKRVSIW